MRVGLVGLGSIGRRHLGNLLALGADVVAMDVSPEAIEKARAAYPHARYGTALSFAGLDALVIATPLDSHLRWVETAVARKLPFFVEKPLGTLEQLPRWREIAALDLPVNQVGYNLRFHTDMRVLRAYVTSPEYGAFVCACDMTAWPGRAYGSPLLECSHELDLALWCGCPAHVEVAHVRGAYAGDVRFGRSRQWSFRFDARAEYVRKWSLGSQRRDITRRFRAPDELGSGMYYAEMSHFLDNVCVGRPTSCHLADGLKVLEVCRQIEQAAA
jgi:predicted dehydrogenase